MAETEGKDESWKKIPKNKRVYTRKVNHPGTKAQPYLGPAWQEARFRVPIALSEGLVQAGQLTPTKLVRLLDRILRAQAEVLRIRAKKLAPVDTRLLSRSINVRKVRVLEYAVGTNVLYAKWVEEGTRPHVIVPRQKKVLLFRGESRGKKRGRGKGKRRR